MSKSRNFKKFDFDIEDAYVPSKKDKKMIDRRREKRLMSALKSKDVKRLYQLEEQ